MKKILGIFFIVLTLLSSGCIQYTKVTTTTEITRQVLKKYKEDNNFYLLLSDYKSREGKRLKVTQNEWDLLKEESYYTFIVEDNTEKLKKQN